MTLRIFAVVVLGLMCGSELNVAAFAHPALSRHSLDVHIGVRSTLAALFGRVMPFWMAGSTLLNLLLAFERLSAGAWPLAATAFALQVATALFSLASPVPIINRVANGRKILPRD